MDERGDQTENIPRDRDVVLKYPHLHAYGVPSSHVE